MSDRRPKRQKSSGPPNGGSLQRIVRRAVALFKCDTARITSPCGRHFLILGWNKNTKTEREAGRDGGQWYQSNGGDFVPIDFDFVYEQVVANGRTLKELWTATKHYKRLLDESRPNTRL